MATRAHAIAGADHRAAMLTRSREQNGSAATEPTHSLNPVNPDDDHSVRRCHNPCAAPAHRTIDDAQPVAHATFRCSPGAGRALRNITRNRTSELYRDMVRRNTQQNVA